MPETLTESFCERCGTRYEFKAARSLGRLRRTRGLVSGLRHYVLSSDSLSDSIDDGVRREEQAVAATQLDAFHSTFNFCLDCRQYTCPKCWNAEAGRCQTCVAGPAYDALAATDAIAWPSAELLPATQASPDADLEAEPEWPAAEPIPAWLEPVTATPEPVTVAPEPVTAMTEPLAAMTEPVTVAPEPAIAWEEDAAFALLPEEPEPVAPPVEEAPAITFAAAVELGLEEAPLEAPQEAAEPAPEPMPRARPKPVPPAEAAHKPKPAPAAPRPKPVPLAARRARQPARRPAQRKPEIAAVRAQLDALGLSGGPVGTEPPKVLPYRSSGAPASATEIAYAQLLAAATDAMWAASSREVAGVTSAIGIRDCGACGLSLSANARFCRRCGAPQTKSA